MKQDEAQKLAAWAEETQSLRARYYEPHYANPSALRAAVREVLARLVTAEARLNALCENGHVFPPEGDLCACGKVNWND